jgi:hypothetical protein
MKVRPIEWKELEDIIVSCDSYEHINADGEKELVKGDYTIIPIDDDGWVGWVGYSLEFRGIYKIGHIRGNRESQEYRSSLLDDVKKMAENHRLKYLKSMIEPETYTYTEQWSK